MNVLERFVQSLESSSDRIALWAPGQPSITFAELRRMAASAQALCRDAGIRPGDNVLMVDRPGPRLYASLLGTVASGACAVLLEPWVSVARAEDLIGQLQPKAFFASTLGKVMALRMPALRNIRTKINPRDIHQDLRGSALELESVDENSPAILTFTSSSDGPSRGVLRRHGALAQQLAQIGSMCRTTAADGPELCVFSNSVLSNLMKGRGSILFPYRWTRRAMSWVDALPPALAPVSVVCGPAFLEEMLEHAPLIQFREVHINRAITDCDTLERGFARWNEASWKYIYGSSESTPVSFIDAKQAVELSRKRGWIQCLALGEAVQGIQVKMEPNGLWIKAPHIFAESQGNWYFTGDRVTEDTEGWWYRGRASVREEDFELEQKIYSWLGTTTCFIQRAPDGTVHLLGEGLKARKDDLLREFPRLQSVVDAKLHYDRRHRAWINRRKVLKSVAEWMLPETK